VIPLALWPYWPWIRKLWWVVPALALLLLAGVYRVQRDSAREDVDRLRAAQAAQEATYRAQVAQWRQATVAAEEGYAEELARLRAAARGPVPVVRLCREPAQVPGGGTAAGGAGGTGAAGGVVPGVPHGDPGVGPDVGPGLYWLADDADRRAAQLRHLIERNRKLAELASAAQ
jgi:hypothetical protein